MASVNETLQDWSEWVGESAQVGSDRQVFRSSDPERTRHAAGLVFCEYELEVAGPSRRLDAALADWPVGKVTVAYMRYGAEVIIRPGRPESFYVVEIPAVGAENACWGRSDVVAEPGSAIVLPATEEVMIRLSGDCERVAIRVDRSALERELASMLCRDIDAPVVFDPTMTLAAPAARDWAGTLCFVLDEIRRGARSLEHPLVRVRIQQLLIDQLLLAQPHNYTEQLLTGHRPARPAAVRHVIDIIQARAAEPLTVSMLAELAGVSVRSLEQGFRDYLGTTPLAYLREVRLARVRDDLLAARDGEGTPVAEIGHRWGFRHLSRFSAYYRRRYGELPSETLRGR